MVATCFPAFRCNLFRQSISFSTSVVRSVRPSSDFTLPGWGNKGNLPSKTGEFVLPSSGNKKYYWVITWVRVIYPTKIG